MTPSQSHEPRATHARPGQLGDAYHGDVIYTRTLPFHRLCGAKGDPDLEEVMSTLTGFGTFAALFEEQISETVSRRILSGDQGMIVWWSIGAGVHVEPHSHPNEQIVWKLKGTMEFRLDSGAAARARWWSFREVQSRK